jgi:glycosyltransferase involved in cell wall biosynthesis
MSLRVAYDVSFAAYAQATGQTQTGVSRQVFEQLHALCRRDDVEVSAVGLMGFDRHPIRTSVQARAYVESLPFSGCGYLQTHRSRFGLTNAYAHKLLEASRAAGTQASAQSPTKRSLMPWPVRMARRVMSHIVAMDAAQVFDDARFDVFHGTYRPLPKRSLTARTPRVAHILDLIPTLSPESVPEVVTREQAQVLRSIDRSRDTILCTTNYVKKELCGYLGISPENVFVAPLAAGAQFRPVSDPAMLSQVRKQYRIPDGPYFLSVSNPQPRKNFPFLIRCFTRLLREQKTFDATLVLVGTRSLGWMNEDLEQALKEAGDLQNRLVFTGFVDEDDFAALYAGTTAFLFPSLSEGFGLPPLEAMACGVPVVSSNATTLPEVVGDAGILLSPTDSDAWCQSILTLYRDMNLRNTLSAKSLARAACFSWDRCAEALVQAYRAAQQMR